MFGEKIYVFPENIKKITSQYKEEKINQIKAVETLTKYKRALKKLLYKIELVNMRSFCVNLFLLYDFSVGPSPVF